MNMNAALRYLFSALEKAQGASDRVRDMVKTAINRFLDLAGMLSTVRRATS